MRGAALLLIASLIGAGCLVEAPAGELPEPAGCVAGALDPVGIRLVEPRQDPLLDDRSLQWDHDSYNVRTCSLPAIGRNVLHPSGVPHKYIGEIDMRGDLHVGVVAVLGNQEAPRVYLLDLKDPALPKVVAWIDQSDTYVTDVKISEDGKVLYTASQGAPGDGILTSPGAPTSPAGFTVYNIETPSKPRYLGTVIDPGGGCHMLSAVQVLANQDAVFCVSTFVRSYLIQRDADRIVNFGFVDYVPQGPPPSGTGIPSPHDMTMFHEGGKFRAGKTYMVVSHWGLGVRVLDISNAPQVQEVGRWMGQGATHYYGNVHTAMMFWAGPNRYVVASPELTSTSAKQVPSLWVLDANDLSNLKLVGEWYHPNEHPAQGLYQTTHQWQVAPSGKNVTADEVRVYLAYNHGGVWVLDFAKMLEKDLWGAILGYNMARAPIDQATAVPNAVLSTWDVGVVDGYVYGSDRATGLWTFHYQGDALGDPRLRGFA